MSLAIGLSVTTAEAVSVADILSMYGKTAAGGDVVKIPTPEEIADVQDTIKLVETANIYNNIIGSYNTSEIDAKIESLATAAKSLEDAVAGAFDAPISQIVEIEEEYKRVTTELTSLAIARLYAPPEQIEVPDVSLEELRKEEKEMLRLAEIGEEQEKYPNIGNLDYYPVVGVKYHVTSKFGYRNDPVGVKGWSLHEGIDLRAPSNTQIGAWFSGTVSKAGYSGSSGNYVWIDHGYGLKTFYCHLNKNLVSVGDVVNQGDVIALSGATGSRSTGPHLHMGLYIDGTPVDPQVILG